MFSGELKAYLAHRNKFKCKSGPEYFDSANCPLEVKKHQSKLAGSMMLTIALLLAFP